MKPLLFFIISLISLSSYLLILLSPYLPAVALAKAGPPIPLSSAQSQTITVTATVDEHLTYLKKGDELIISTNLPSNFVIFLPLNSQKFYISGPAEKNFPNLQSFILVAEF